MNLPYTEGDPTSARIAIIGEAPGAKEESSGLPFQGPSGSLLNKILAAVGIARSSCYITNVVKERPPKNNISKFISLKPVHTKTTPEYDSYEQVLFEELKQLKNLKVIVPMGNVSIYALLRKQGITKQRGSYFEWNGIPVIPTIHPASAIRNYMNTHLIRADFSKVRKLINGEDVSPLSQNLIVEPTYEEAITHLDEARVRGKNHARIGFDTEVVITENSMEVSHVSFSYEPYSAISINFITGNDHTYNAEEELIIWLKIAEILEDTSIRKVWQNAMFDIYFLFRKYGIRTRNYDDTMIAQALSLPDFKKGLDFICSIHTRQPYYKDEGKKHFKRDLIAGVEFHKYSAQDARVLLEAWPSLWKDIQSVKNEEIYNKVIALTEALLYMEAKGILVNTKRLEELKIETEATIVSTVEKIKEVMGGINTGSVKQLKEYFYEKNQEGKVRVSKPYINRKTGQPRVDEDALKRIARKGLSEASLILEKRKAEKLKSTYLDVALSQDNRFKMSLNPVGTRQLRLSSSANIFGEGTNAQNLPSTMKKLLMADPGYMIFEVDKSQAENRMVAYIAPEPRMIEAFELYDAGRGPDVHRMTAALIFGKDPNEISDVEGSSDIGDGHYSERDWGKRANHGLNYGMGPNLFSLRYEIPINQAKYIHAQYHRAYPGVQNYHRKVRNELNASRTLTNIFGFSYRFLDRWGKQLFKQAYSFNPQSSVAYEINYKGIVPIYQIERPSFEKVELLNQVHDSILFQLPISIGFDAIAKTLIDIKEVLEAPINHGPFTFSIPVDYKGGKCLATAEKYNLNDSISNLAEKLENNYYASDSNK